MFGGSAALCMFALHSKRDSRGHHFDSPYLQGAGFSQAHPGHTVNERHKKQPLCEYFLKGYRVPNPESQSHGFRMIRPLKHQ